MSDPIVRAKALLLKVERGASQENVEVSIVAIENELSFTFTLGRKTHSWLVRPRI
jgi:hypothetical protein